MSDPYHFGERSGSMMRADLESWMDHYERFHGLPRDQF